MPENILQHHNRIVHHQPDGQHQSQQREGIDGKTCQCHQGKGTHQTDGNRDDGNQRCTQGTQKNEDHQRHQNHGLNDGFVNVFDRAIDENRVVVGDVNQHARGEISFQSGDGFPNPSGQIQRIGRCLANDPHSHSRAAIQADSGALFSRGFLNARHIPHLDRKAIDRFNHDIAKLAWPQKVSL